MFTTLYIFQGFMNILFVHPFILHSESRLRFFSCISYLTRLVKSSRHTCSCIRNLSTCRQEIQSSIQINGL